MNKLATSFILITAFIPSAFADVSKWVDEKGVTHYGDTTPNADAAKPKLYNVKPNNGYSDYSLDSYLEEGKKRTRLEDEREFDRTLDLIASGELNNVEKAKRLIAKIEQSSNVKTQDRGSKLDQAILKGQLAEIKQKEIEAKKAEESAKQAEESAKQEAASHARVEKEIQRIQRIKKEAAEEVELVSKTARNRAINRFIFYSLLSISLIALVFSVVIKVLQRNKIKLNRDLLGLFGSGMLLGGAFVPIFSLPIVGNISYFQAYRWAGVILIILAIMSFIFVGIKKFNGLWISAIGSLILLLITFLGFIEISDKSEGSSLSKIGEQMIQLQWGWILLIIGVLSLILCAALKEQNQQAL
jgi:hypothetical protein